MERQPGYAWIIKPQKHYGLVWDASNVDHYEKETIAMTEFRYFALLILLQCLINYCTSAFYWLAGYS